MLNRERLAEALDYTNAMARGGAAYALKLANEMLAQENVTWKALLLSDPENYISKEKPIREWALKVKKKHDMAHVIIKNQQEEITRLRRIVGTSPKRPEEFDEYELEPLFKYLLHACNKSDQKFVRSLKDGYGEYGSLTEKQLFYLEKIYERT